MPQSRKQLKRGFHPGLKGTLGKYLKRKRRKKKRSHRRRVENKAAFLSELTRANPHMHDDAGSSRLKGRTLGLNASALGWKGGGGGAQTIRLVKRRLQNSQNVWNSASVSHPPALSCPHKSKAAPCAGVEVQSPPATSEPDTVNKLLFFYSVLSRHAQFFFVLEPFHLSRLFPGN